MNQYTTSGEGRRDLERHEGRRYTAYRDVAGHYTIGVGHKITPFEQQLITATLTDAQVDAMLTEDLRQFEADVRSLVTVPISQRQFDALVSFAFNLGSDIDADTIPEGLGDSTLLKRINAGAPMDEIGVEWIKWNKARVNGALIPVAGLTRRRSEEFAVFRDNDMSAVKKKDGPSVSRSQLASDCFCGLHGLGSKKD